MRAGVWGTVTIRSFPKKCIVNKGKGLPQWLIGKESTCNAGDAGLMPGSGGSPGEGHSNSLQYSCGKTLTDRGWWATVPGVANSGTQLSD